ncbi:OprO/OprP family phosphate-selective porin [Novosphingobium mangrovi (ex Hu et al. 2023)]|uniref:Porin n=1 Tax=Novosphingobium mangrovi (ex Hu et al. 2023) TaxID=2930094 RepID=A0ABT0AFG8_9SPHN|nr:porin [Novosphingobium mangrovi (ex Hu et al. 2023)]MCJ1961948.1 porin [Novosphingobium mangrovi (ex Hu et al. 2023)]
MRSVLGISAAAVALVLAGGAPIDAYAADGAQAGADSSVARELAEMRAQMARMAARIADLEAQVAQGNGAPAAVPSAAATPALAANAGASPAPVVTAAAAPAKAAGPDVKVKFKGGPEVTTSDGWAFKLGGRLNLDAGYIDAPDSLGPSDGFGSEVRRARLRVTGKIPGGFGYKFETEFAPGAADFTDAYVSYQDGGLTIEAGQHNTFQGLEELSSSLNTSFIERAAYTDAFNFERRIGISAQYSTGDLLLQGGIFSDNAEDTPNKNFSVDTRVVYAPKIGSAQVHLGGSYHYAKLPEQGSAVRYRQRPFEHFTSTRYINTGLFSADAEIGYGLESAVIAGRFHASAEGHWQHVSRPVGDADPTFFGGAIEVGYFLTGGDTRGYKHGTFDRVKPARPVGEGGFGALQLNLRYDYLDLTDAGIVGGSQKGYEASLIWTQTDYTRLMLNYARLDYTDAFYQTADGSRSYGVDVIAMRAQVDF